MSEYTPQMLETIANVEGEWIYETSELGVSIKLSISRDKCVLQYITKGEVNERVEFNGNNAWHGSWLCYYPNSDARQFYVNFATNKLLLFGEYKGDTVGQGIQWERRFNRVK